jgi:hypothetical protein
MNLLQSLIAAITEIGTDIKALRATPPGGGSAPSVVEVELDFGTNAAQISSWTIPVVGVTVLSKILVFPSPNTATDRIGNDWEIDAASFTAKFASAGNITIFAVSQHRIIGKRKIFYQIN